MRSANMKRKEKEIKVPAFDYSGVYQEKIEPHVREIEKICASYGVPCLMSFAITNNNNGTGYKNSIVHASASPTCDDRIARMMMALNGCEEKPPKEVEASIRLLRAYLTNISAVNSAIRKETQRLADDNAPRIPRLKDGNILQKMVNIAVANTRQEVPYSIIGGGRDDKDFDDIVSYAETGEDDDNGDAVYSGDGFLSDDIDYDIDDDLSSLVVVTDK